MYSCLWHTRHSDHHSPIPAESHFPKVTLYMICMYLFYSDEEKPGSAKKRRKSASGTPLSRVGSPGTTPFKPAMTERQQMALLLQMTDPNKQHASK